MDKADFYIGKDKDALWLGSLSKVSSPDRLAEEVLSATTRESYKGRVKKMLMKSKYSFLPGGGWPWVWETSELSDFAYFFFDEKVYVTCISFQGALFDPIMIAKGLDLKAAYTSLYIKEWPNTKEFQ